MIAVDTNILVYAHRSESEFFRPARTCIDRLAGETEAWAIPWPCIHEFVTVVTKRGYFALPSSTEQALNQLQIWMESSSLTILGETERHWPVLRDILLDSDAHGPPLYDARIAALCIEHGVTELWSANKDFTRFPMLRTWNPLQSDRLHDTSPRYAAAIRARSAGRRRALAVPMAE